MSEKNPAEQHAARLEALHAAMWNDTSPRGVEYRAKAKELFPDVVTPDDQFAPAVAPLRAELDETKAQLTKFLEDQAAERKAASEAAAKQNLESALDGARSRYSLTDEGFDKMVSRMKETQNFTDADAAAAWVAQQTPVTNVTKASYMPSKANFLGSARETQDEAVRFLHQHPDDFLELHLQEFDRDPMAYGKAA